MTHDQPREPVGRTAEAVVLAWPAPADGRKPALPVRRRVEELCALGVHVALVSDSDFQTVDRWLGARPMGPGRLWLAVDKGSELVEIDSGGRVASRAACPGGKAGMMPALLRELDTWGIGPGLVLLVGDDFSEPTGARQLCVPGLDRGVTVSVGAEPSGLPAGVVHLGGGAAMVRTILDEQLRRRRRGRVPSIDPDPLWTLTEQAGEPLRTRVTETLFTLGAGGFGTRGAVEDPADGSVSLVVAAGVYTGDGSDQHLLPGPLWTRMGIDPPMAQERRILDLRTGVLLREELHAEGTPVRVMRLASVAMPGVVAMCAEGGPRRLRPGPPLRSPEGAMEHGSRRSRSWARVLSSRGGGIVAVAGDRRGLDGGVRTVRRLAGYTAEADRPPDCATAEDLFDRAERTGFDRLLADHRQVWASRWQGADVSIPADPDAQLAVRFALFALWSTVDRHDEVAVGARGLSGPGYRGHVFWDADVFVLPAVAALDRRAARAMIQYRLSRLAAAGWSARSLGMRGARFPWESAAEGVDVTPTAGYLGGQRVPILTGAMEEHITADVAWAAWHYAQWCGDRAFAAGPASRLLVRTARYWASRLRVDASGRAHLDGVIGPDEYHENVADNAFTNVMARWNLRRGAEAVGPGEERDSWLRLADSVVDGYDPDTGIYEQFAGYSKLRPWRAAEVATPPFAADVLLGQAPVAASQLIKQPDVLMLHHLVPEEVEPGSLAPNLDFYGPRTAHGSSLSPAISASLSARAGRPDEALAMLRAALRLDLDDLNGTTAAGLHLATIGGVWQAVLFGFAGAHVRAGTLRLDPCLPSAWPSLGVRFQCLGRQVRVDIDERNVTVEPSGPLSVQVGQGPAHRIRERTRFSLEGDRHE